jgi:hypothetical protein
MRRKPLLLVLLSFLILPFAAQGAPLSGKLTVRGKGAAGARLLAWPVSASTLTGDPAHRSGATGADGVYSLDLPPGEYYLIAEGADFFAFYGRNPVTVPAEGLKDVNIGLLPRTLTPPERKTEVTTGMIGKVTADGKPLEGAVVYVYPDLTTRFKGMGLGMAETDKDGIFEAEVPAGTYYLLIRWRRSHETTGPLRAGDYIGYYAANPLRVSEGKLQRLAVPMLEVPEKVERYAENLFGTTSLHGRITDPEGKPVAGVRAIIYDEATMLNRPLYVSQPTGEDGRFVLSLPRGGTYYLAARNTLGGAPAPGDLYGTFDKSPDHSLKVKNGEELKGIEIVVERTF